MIFKFFLSIIGVRRKHRTRPRPVIKYERQALGTNDINQQLACLPKAKVTHVIDGDTVIVSMGWREINIRLDFIDCPEGSQVWGDIALYGLIKLIGRKTVWVEEHGTDIHGRILATLYVWNNNQSNWINVNERMVTLGHAWVMRRFYNHLSKDRQNKLNNLEQWAKSKKLGLWRELNPIPPWEWRNNQKL